MYKQLSLSLNSSVLLFLIFTRAKIFYSLVLSIIMFKSDFFRSVSVLNGSGEPPEKFVKYLARHEYKLEIDFTEKVTKFG